MTNNNTFAASKYWRSRLKLIAVFSLFLGPLLVAFFWYYGLGALLLPQGKTNHSSLIEPLVVLKPFENSAVQNNLFEQERISLASFKHKWSIIHLLNDDCLEPCQKALYNTRQTWIALGKEAGRIQRYIIINDTVAANIIQQHHADILLLQPSAQGIEKQLRPIIEQHNIGKYDALLVDPLGNVMMMIPLELDPRLLLKDLKKLLKVSRIG